MKHLIVGLCGFYIVEKYSNNNLLRIDYPNMKFVNGQYSKIKKEFFFLKKKKSKK